VIVEIAWKLSMDMWAGQVWEVVHNVALDLTNWSSNVLGDLDKRIKKAQRVLEEHHRAPVTSTTPGRLDLLTYKLERLEDQKNIYWRQRAKVHWLENGD
jgi:hypothetical protein